MIGEGVASGILGLGSSLIDKLFTSDTEKSEAKLKFIALQQQGEFKREEQKMSAIITEASSKHKAVALARPMFLYVMYAMILVSIPMGILSAFKPEMATAIADGMQSWLAAIPEYLYTAFTVGYLGYTGARTIDKRKKKEIEL